MVSSFKATVVLHLQHNGESDVSIHNGVKAGLEISRNLDYDTYIDGKGLPTKVGTTALTNVLIQGLVANIHRANIEGHWKDHEHIKFIIEELQRGFIEVPHMEEEAYELRDVFK